MLDAAKEWGFNGDGAADSTAAFLRMRDAFLSDRDRMWEIEFPPGRYLTRAPHWLDSVGRVRLIGYGATLQHMMPNYGLFATGEPFRTEIWNEPFTDPQREHHPGYKIASVEAGADQLRFLSGALPPGVIPGAVVFVGGYVQQTANNHLPLEQRVAAGWPPNLRFFEYAVVRAVGASSATLARPLAQAYDETWWDYPGDDFGAYIAGAPRLYLCNRPGFDIPLHVEMLGFSFARAAGSAAGAGHIGFKPALHLHLEDCTIQDELGLGCFVQMNDRVTLRRCRLDDLEIDKCLRHVLIDDCDLGGLTSDGAGALEVEVRRSRIYGDCRVNPRTSVVIDGATAFQNFALNARHGGYYDSERFTMTVRASRR